MAEKDGYGKGASTSMTILADATQVRLQAAELSDIKLDVRETSESLVIGISQADGKELTVRLMDMGGRILLTKRISIAGRATEIQLDKKDLLEGILILSASSSTQYVSRKVVIRR